MMSAVDVLREAHARVLETTAGALAGLTPEQLATRPDLGAGPNNSIGWLVWHLTREEDAQIAELAGTEEVWVVEGWAERFSLPYPEQAIGYGMSSDDVGRFPSLAADLLLDYQRATHEATVGYLDRIGQDDLTRIVDDRWDPPVTGMVRLVSIIDDAVQHAGQAAYVRGLLLV